MARQLYTSQLWLQESVYGVVSLGGPPAGYIWVVREAFITFGIGLQPPGAAFSFSPTGEPGFWVLEPAKSQLVSYGHGTIRYKGRFVVPEGETLYLVTGDYTVDTYGAGYELWGPPAGSD